MDLSRSSDHQLEEPRVAAARADAHAEADRRFISAVAGQANSATHSVAKRIRPPGLAEVAARVQHREVCGELRRAVWRPPPPLFIGLFETRSFLHGAVPSV